ncbi:MAG: IclR family transcriptional regulator [Actinomycetota bacterium]
MSETVQSIDRAMTLLTAIAERPDNLSGLARRADIPTSTTGRLLATLEQAGTVAKTGEGTYRIGPAILAMARSAQPLTPSLELSARSHLTALADQTGEAAGLSVPIGDTSHGVTQDDAPKPVQAEDWAGRSWPLHQGGSGIVVLATEPADRLDDYLTRNRGIDGPELRAKAAAARRSGVSWSHGDYREGLSSVAAPIVDQDGAAVGALYLYGPSYRFPADGADGRQLAKLLIDHATRLSAELASGS